MKSYVNFFTIFLLFLMITGFTPNKGANQNTQVKKEVAETQFCAWGKLKYYRDGTISVYVKNNCGYRKSFSVWINGYRYNYWVAANSWVETNATYGAVSFRIWN